MRDEFNPATDDDLKDIISKAVSRKNKRHGGIEDIQALSGNKNRSMIRIGG